MQTLETLLFCSQSVHCKTCRRMISGTQFRIAVVGIIDLPTSMFDCPYGKDWIKDETVAVEESTEVKTRSIAELVSAITTDDPADRWIKSIIPQIQDEMKRHEEKGEPCKARRCREKIAARWQEYLQQKKQLTTDKDSAYTVADRGGSNA